VTAGAFQTTFGGTCDAWVAKVGPDGKVLWSTYLWGILDDWATGIALDGAGSVLVSGYTRSANFPLVSAIESTLSGGGSTGAFITNRARPTAVPLGRGALAGAGVDLIGLGATRSLGPSRGAPNIPRHMGGGNRSIQLLLD
jgi:hypothetical protein